jgi:EpsI family protein
VTAPTDGWAPAKCLAIVLAIAVVWPVWAVHIEHLAEARTMPVRLALPEAAGSWRAAQALTDWAPSYVGPDANAKMSYGDGADTVDLHLMYYRRQRQGAELINTQNILIHQKHPVWKMPEEKPVQIRLNGKPATVLQGHLQSPAQKLVTWRWNRIGKAYTANEYAGKLLEARDKLFGRMGDGAAIIIAAEYAENPEPATAVLQRFVDAMLPSLEQSLNRAAGD